MKNKQKLQSQFDKLRNQLFEINQKEENEKNTKLIGKCFKYRNNYGSECPGWWLYKKIIKVDKEIRIFSFQLCEGGRFEIEKSGFLSYSNGQEITQIEFTNAWREFKKEFASLDLIAL